MVFYLKKRDEVFLLMKNLRTNEKSKELYNIKVWPFFIKANKQNISFNCKVSKNLKVYPIFYLLVSDPAESKTLIQDMFYS